MYGVTPQERHTHDATPEDEHTYDVTLHPGTRKRLALCTPPLLLGLKGGGGGSPRRTRLTVNNTTSTAHREDEELAHAVISDGEKRWEIRANNKEKCIKQVDASLSTVKR